MLGSTVVYSNTTVAAAAAVARSMHVAIAVLFEPAQHGKQMSLRRSGCEVSSAQLKPYADRSHWVHGIHFIV